MAKRHLLTTAQVADQLGMTQEWVRDHRVELGAIKMGDSPGARLRFEPDVIEQWIERKRLTPPAPAPPRRRPGPRPAPAGIELLPIPPRSFLTARRGGLPQPSEALIAHFRDGGS